MMARAKTIESLRNTPSLLLVDRGMYYEIGNNHSLLSRESIIFNTIIELNSRQSYNDIKYYYIGNKFLFEKGIEEYL